MSPKEGIAAALVIVAMVSGCAATRPQTPPRPSPMASLAALPSDGILLTSLGFSNAPDGFSLPIGSVIIERVDQPNVVSAVIEQPDGSQISEYLRKTLPTLGFTISADANGSLLFADRHFDGAFTSAQGRSGLALRLVR